MIRTEAIAGGGPCHNPQKIGASLPTSLWLTPVFGPFTTQAPYVQTLSGLELCLIKMDQQRESGYAIGFVNFFLCSGRYDGRYGVRLFLFIARKIVG